MKLTYTEFYDIINDLNKANDKRVNRLLDLRRITLIAEHSIKLSKQ
jgi:hypothetical protein